MTIETRQARTPRYRVSLAIDGAFLIHDRRAMHKRTARFFPAEFTRGCMSYDERTARYPDYVHAELWRLHDCRSREQLRKSQAARVARVAPLFDELRKLQTTNVTEGAHITLAGNSVESHTALVEHIKV